MAEQPRDLDDGDEPPRRRRREDDFPVGDRPAGRSKTTIILAAVGGVVLLGCCGIGGCFALMGVGTKQAADRDAKEVASGPALVFEADALHGEYDANEVAADGKYNGKVVEVSGTVKEISKGPFGGQYVSLQSAKNQFATSVRCDFPRAAEAALAKLTKGQRVTIRGKCTGFTLGSVQLDNCTLK